MQHEVLTSSFKRTKKIPSKKTIPLFIASILLAISMNAQKLSAYVSVTSVTCAGDSNGTGIVHASGGFPPYTYLWEPGGQTTDTATGLGAGTYTVTVIDSLSDSTYAYSSLVSVSTLAVSTSSFSVSCFGDFNGKAIVNISGGVSPYHVLWTPGLSTAIVDTGLGAGTYTSTIIDSVGCAASASTTVAQPAPLALTASGIAGLATAYASGGTSPYTYSWAPGGATTATVSGLNPGTYTITVNDSNFCTNSAVVTIDTTIITFAISNYTVDCTNGYVNFDITATSSPPTFFNSSVIDIKYSGNEFSGDSVTFNATLGNVIVQPLIYTYPLQNTNLSDSVLQIVMSDTSYTPLHETLLDSVPTRILTVGFLIQNSCQYGTIGFTNELYTGPTCYHTLYAKVLDYTDTVLTQTVDSLFNPHTCDSLCNPYLCNLHCCNYDANNSCTDSCYDICYNTCPYTCYDTVWTTTLTVDSVFTTYSKDFSYNTAAYLGNPITDSAVCPPSITDYISPMNAGVGGIFKIWGGNFGSTRGTGRVEFYDADTSNFYIKN